MRSFKTILLLLLAFLVPQSLANLHVHVQQGKYQAIPIAINQFKISKFDDRNYQELISVIKNDLNSSKLFKIIPNSNPDNKTGEETPIFSLWRNIGAFNVLNGSIQQFNKNLLVIQIVLWDIATERQIMSWSISGNLQLIRRMAHKIADKIYQSLIGHTGYFDSKISFIELDSSINKRNKLVIMDQDGHNRQIILNANYILGTPRFSPTGDKLLYFSYRNRKPQVFMYDFINKKHSIVGNLSRDMVSFDPRFSPDGKKVIMSIAKNGITNIYELNLENNNLRQLTYDFSINTGASYAPDGSKIYFSSDRSGANQIYMINADGSGMKRITGFGGEKANYTCSSISPDGKYLAFSKLNSQGFHIGIIKTDGTEERILTRGFRVQSPNWSPNSQNIIFGKETLVFIKGKLSKLSRIGMVDIHGMFETELISQEEVYDPQWSPLRD